MNNGPEYYSSAAFYRDQRGFSNSSLSDASGISRTTIIKICAGELTPGVENQQKLADALHIDTEDLIFCSDSETVKKSVIDMEEFSPPSVLFLLILREKKQTICPSIFS